MIPFDSLELPAFLQIDIILYELFALHCFKDKNAVQWLVQADKLMSRNRQRYL